MILRCFSIYDRKALIYNPPYFAPTDGAAVRVVTDAANDPNNNLGRHPGDYVLYFVGTYDDEKGVMKPADPLVHVVDLASVVQVQPPLPLERHDLGNGLIAERKAN